MIRYAVVMWVRNDETVLHAIDVLVEEHGMEVPLRSLRKSLTNLLGYDPVLPCAVQSNLEIYQQNLTEALVYRLQGQTVVANKAIPLYNGHP